MPTICSATRKGDKTVGTSTNCSANCGTGRREREEHGFCGGCGGCGSDARLVTYVFPSVTVDAPNWSGRTPGSQTPGVPATLNPRRRRTLRHRGPKNGHSRPGGRSSKNAIKCGKNPTLPFFRELVVRIREQIHRENSGNSSKIDRRLTHVRVYTQRAGRESTSGVCPPSQRKSVKFVRQPPGKGRIDLGIRGPPSRNEMREIPRPPCGPTKSLDHGNRPLHHEREKTARPANRDIDHHIKDKLGIYDQNDHRNRPLHHDKEYRRPRWDCNCGDSTVFCSLDHKRLRELT